LPWARNILDSLSLETADDSVFYDYHDLAISLKEDTLTWFDMDSTQHALVNSIAAGSSSVKLRAQAVQTIIGDSVYARLPEQLPGTMEFRLAQEEPVSEPIVSESKLTVFPNPFSNEFTVSYVLPDTAKRVVFEVIDLAGRVIYRKSIAAVYKGSEVLTIGDCKGFYLLRVMADDRTVKTVKIICTE
jgi:hypothetical protein